MEQLDVNGTHLKVGDSVVFGENNGSTLHAATIIKLTPKYVWMFRKDDTARRWIYKRWYDRVARV